MKLSILVPSIPSRIEKYLLPLYAKLAQMAEGKEVEVLALLDNKQRSIGLKRDALVQSALGDYVAFVDDDDDVSHDYVDALLEATAHDMDVITFKQRSSIDGETFTVTHGLGFIIGQAHRGADGRYVDIARPPWHHCAWRRSIAAKHRFPDSNYGEDWDWCSRVLKDVSTQSYIDRELHFYNFRSDVTEALSS